MLPPLVLWGLILIIVAVLVLPFVFHVVERNLEVFLFIMGVLAVTISKLWSGHLVVDAILDPIKIDHPIVEAVLFAGLIFRFLRDKMRRYILNLETLLGVRTLMFLIVVVLGIFSSVITAIIASLVLVELISSLKFDKKSETNLVIVACYSIGLGAALTPIGEPLATIAIAKLRGFPYHADFWFLFNYMAYNLRKQVYSVFIII